MYSEHCQYLRQTQKIELLAFPQSVSTSQKQTDISIWVRIICAGAYRTPKTFYSWISGVRARKGIRKKKGKENEEGKCCGDGRK